MIQKVYLFSLKQMEDKEAISSAVFFRAISKWAAWTTLAKWQSAANSRPCFSAHCSTLPILFLIFNPHRWLQKFLLSEVTIWLKVHRFMKWKSWEKSWIVKAAFTRHFLNKPIADPRIFKMPWVVPSSSSVSDMTIGMHISNSSVRQLTRNLKALWTVSANMSWACKLKSINENLKCKKIHLLHLYNMVIKGNFVDARDDPLLSYFIMKWKCENRTLFLPFIALLKRIALFLQSRFKKDET